MPVVETEGLVKDYGRGVLALQGVSLRVEPGQIYGLLGPNGAGKTTLVKILLGIVHKTAGQAYVLGQPAGQVRVRYRIGYLPEDHQFPPYHTAWSLLDFYGQLYGLRRSERRRRIPEVLELVGLAPRARFKIRTYSKGMKQRLGIAQTLLHQPEVLFLDEPTDGVDPVGRREIRELMIRLREQGRTIFLNSHLLGEVELICDRVAILRQGRLVLEGSVDDLTRQRGCFEIGLASGEVLPVEAVQQLGYTVRPLPLPPAPPGGSQAISPRWEILLRDGQSIDPLVHWLVQQQLHLRHLVERRLSLEE
ncbi:MAG: ABC transporter ATP-binding protein, partial [Gemmataceae bacterium]|nr:ABC transporter ATP-binding protein [Gemmataceae bacterium]